MSTLSNWGHNPLKAAGKTGRSAAYKTGKYTGFTGSRHLEQQIMQVPHKVKEALFPSMPSLIYPEEAAPTAGDRAQVDAMAAELRRRKLALGRSALIKTGELKTLGDAPVQRKNLLGI